jgi:hypothetical protein
VLLNCGMASKVLSTTTTSAANSATTASTNPGTMTSFQSSSAPAQPPAKQIPIVCPGHTRPLAELQFCETTTSNTTSSGSGGVGGGT